MGSTQGGASHGAEVRGLQRVPDSAFAGARFGRMFQDLDPFRPDVERLTSIAQRMVEESPSSGSGDNPKIPSGYTYFGQFVDHDLTFDPTSTLTKRADPDALHDFRTPRFDLDNCYGRGPQDQPYLYTADGAFVLGRGEDASEVDLPRTRRGVAIIGDPRNDENILVSQLQATMLSFHNRVLEDVRAGKLDAHLHSDDEDDHFAEAQRIVRWHYQWAVVRDYLRRIVGPDMADAVLRPDGTTDLRFYRWRRAPFMPVEFSVAAYRFGHSMIRARYDLNDVIRDVAIFDPRPTPGNALTHLGGHRVLPAAWQIAWPFFVDLDEQGPQPSRVLDVRLAPPLSELPSDVATGFRSLALRNLVRGSRLGLPSGQAVARAMGTAVLTRDELDLPGPDRAPLWYYVLREAQVRHNGRHLGEVGGRIVAEVFIGLLEADPASWLSVEPAWKPFLGRGNDFSLPDLIRYTKLGHQRR
ncbi:MAG TPA: heme peroxidase family protein [Nocardioidaceae bacterium]|jgi:hypothetical protein|nr:heme peroxidase family protein [Nocardioidaceae bacterium]